MSQIRLMIADRDFMFLEKFGSYLQKNKANRFSLELITTPSNLENWLINGGKADLTVVASSMFSELTRKPDCGSIAILSDCPESLLPQGYTILQKYKPAEILMKDILSLCSEKLPESLVEKGEQGKLELVLYADGSDAANPIAQAIACIRAQDRKSVFYMSLDELSNTNAYFTGNNEKGLSEMLYYVKAQKDNLTLKAEACSSKDTDTGVNFMNGHKNPEDLGKLSPSELELLIKSVSGRGYYEEIIISRAFRYDPLLPVLLKRATKVYITALDYRTSIERLKKISDLFIQMDRETGSTLKNKASFYLQKLDRLPHSQNIVLQQFPLVYLPCPFEEGAEVFPPSGQYISALRSALD